MSGALSQIVLLVALLAPEGSEGMLRLRERGTFDSYSGCVAVLQERMAAEPGARFNCLPLYQAQVPVPSPAVKSADPVPVAVGVKTVRPPRRPAALRPALRAVKQAVTARHWRRRPRRAGR